jgi:hypothetical protein
MLKHNSVAVMCRKLTDFARMRGFVAAKYELEKPINVKPAVGRIHLEMQAILLHRQQSCYARVV